LLEVHAQVNGTGEGEDGPKAQPELKVGYIDEAIPFI
jgi:hypothetical protein